ncbi:UNVERIFIED_CONTAM: hypothetical protein PYX00_008771 [Menopon gallinae]|uniref:Uncharacterized protein n=1 Tax=Menopon gallinae TaxID=328185 RepID=A0AAW2HQ96_9NEOP
MQRFGLSREAKLIMYRATYVPILTYGHRVREMTERTRSRIRAAEMRFLRAAAGATRIDRCRNTAICERLQDESVFRTEVPMLRCSRFEATPATFSKTGPIGNRGIGESDSFIRVLFQISFRITNFITRCSSNVIFPHYVIYLSYDSNILFPVMPEVSVLAV